MTQNKQERKYFSEETYEIIDRILGGTNEQALEVLTKIRGFKPIPGLDMMTSPMVRRLVRGVKTGSVLHYANKCGVPYIKGKWETDDENLVSISDYLRAAGIDCDLSDGMKLVGCGARNSRVNLYEPKAILAIMYACASSRSRIELKVRTVYGLDPAPVRAELVGRLPAPEPGYSATFTPEFVAELVKACVRESVAAALRARQS